MKLAAFDHLPGQAAWIDESVPAVDLRDIVGIGQGWSMPLAVYEAAKGFDAAIMDQQTHHTLAVARSAEADVERVNGVAAGARIRRNDLCIQHLGETHHYRSVGGIRFAHIYFKPSLFSMLSDESGAQCELREDRVSFEDPILFREAHAYLDRALGRDDAPTSLEMNARAIVIASLLVERHSVFGLARRAMRGGLAPWQLKRVKEAMDAHLDEDVSLEMLADVAGCSPTHFSRAFKQSTGVPPFQWLAERRVERAKTLLEENRLSLAEVALAVGFAAHSQFTTAFGRATGSPPGAWRRERLS